MPDVSFHSSGFSISMRREEIAVNSWNPRKVPDKDWLYFDKQGHAHAWDIDKGAVPSIERVKTGTTWIGDEYDGQEIDLYEYRCKVCGEVIEPKHTTTYDNEVVYGPPVLTFSMGYESWPISQKDAYTLVEIIQRVRNGESHDE